MGRSINVSPHSRFAVKKNPRTRKPRRSSEESRLMALSAANKIAEISSAVLTPGAKDRGYVVSEVSARVNRGDITGALSVAYQAAKSANISGNYSTFTLDEAAKDIVFKVSQGWSSPQAAEKIRGLLYKRNPSDGIRIVHNKLLGGWYVVRGPHQTPLNGRFNSKQEAQAWLERQRLPAHLRRNPAIQIRSTSRRAGRGARGDYLKGRRRHQRFAEQRGFGVDESFHLVQVKRGARWITLAGFPRGDLGKSRAKQYGQMMAAAHARNTFRVFWPDSHVKKNPAPRGSSSSASQAEIDQAARLRESFTGHKTTTAKEVRTPRANAGLAVGPLLAVAYETIRDGKREKYLHEFRRGARPTLAASSDGRVLFLLGGAYRFTERGIVDGK